MAQKVVSIVGPVHKRSKNSTPYGIIETRGMEHDGMAERSNEYGDSGYSRMNSTRSLTSKNQSDDFV